MIYRFLSEYILRASVSFPAILLTGARQTGKTTLLRSLFPDHHYVTLDLPSVAAQAEENPERFFAEHPEPVIIDEVQYAPGLFRHLKRRIDEDRHAAGNWILTGSQKFSLMKGVSESLAGRIAVIELEGLSSDETAPETEDFDPLILRGGFPELWRVSDLDADLFFSSYLATYLERDVRQILNIGSLRDFEQFIRLLAARNAQLLDMTALGRDLGISAKTAGAWVSVLEASGQITLLEPWFGNVGKRIVKTPKVYFNDTGLLAWLLGLNRAFASGPFGGALWETFIFAELRKRHARTGGRREIFFYRDNQSLEVDFILTGAEPVALEVKAASEVRTDRLNNLRRFENLANASGNPALDGLKLACVSRSTVRRTIRQEEQKPIEMIPVGRLGELFEP